MSSGFKWTKQKSDAAIALSQGRTQADVAAEVGVSDRAIRKWLAEPEFAAEVDRLSVMVNISSRAERLRIAMRVARQKVHEDGTVLTDKDILEWLKFAQSETDGIKLDLTRLASLGADDESK